MKIATKKIPAGRKILTEADIKGPMMVYTRPRTQKELEEIAQWFAARKEARNSGAKKQAPKNIKPKMIS